MFSKKALFELFTAVLILVKLVRGGSFMSLGNPKNLFFVSLLIGTSAFCKDSTLSKASSLNGATVESANIKAVPLKSKALLKKIAPNQVSETAKGVEQGSAITIKRPGKSRSATASGGGVVTGTGTDGDIDSNSDSDSDSNSEGTPPLPTPTPFVCTGGPAVCSPPYPIDPVVPPPPPADDICVTNSARTSTVYTFGAALSPQWGNINATYSYADNQAQQTNAQKARETFGSAALPVGGASDLSQYVAARGQTDLNLATNNAPFYAHQKYGTARTDSRFYEFKDNLVPAVNKDRICNVKIRGRFVGTGSLVDTDGISIGVQNKNLAGKYDGQLVMMQANPPANPVLRGHVGVRDILPACFFSSASCLNQSGQPFPTNLQAAAKKAYFEFNLNNMPMGANNGVITGHVNLIPAIRSYNNVYFYLQDDSTPFGLEIEVISVP